MAYLAEYDDLSRVVSLLCPVSLPYSLLEFENDRTCAVYDLKSEFLRRVIIYKNISLFSNLHFLVMFQQFRKEK